MLKSRWVSWLALGTMSVQLFAGPLAHAEGWIVVGGQTTVQKLAKQIDKLERHVDEYGSVVSKVPDVWGEERLTIHRDEYERTMAATLNQFQGTINAQVRRSDDAFLAAAVAVSSAVGNNPPTTVINVTKDKGDVIQSTKTTTTITPVDVPAADPASVLGLSGAETGLSTGFVTTSQSLRRSVQDSADQPANSGQVALEPTEYLDQLSRYVNHLHELRRINAGDDTKTLPGYALNLIRVPVSVMPGSKTREGYGAEITFTVSPQIGPELLSTTFRSMVLNDIEYQLAMPLTMAVNKRPDGVWKTLEILAKALDTSCLRYSWGDSSWWGDFTFQNEMEPEALKVWARFILDMDKAGLLKSDKANSAKSVLSPGQIALLTQVLDASEGDKTGKSTPDDNTENVSLAEIVPRPC